MNLLQIRPFDTHSALLHAIQDALARLSKQAAPKVKYTSHEFSSCFLYLPVV